MTQPTGIVAAPHPPEPTPPQAEDAHLHNRVFIGGKDVINSRLSPTDLEDPQKLRANYESALKELRIRLGTLLKLDNVSFLIGAGCSLAAGGVSLASIPYKVEKQLLDEGRPANRTATWLRTLYRCLSICAADVAKREPDPIRRSALDLLAGSIIDIPTRKSNLTAASPTGNPVSVDELYKSLFPLNLESVLSSLYMWQAASLDGKVALRLEDAPTQMVRVGEIERVIQNLRSAFLATLRLPSEGRQGALDTHRRFVSRVLTRPVNLRRVNLFTLNGDALLEKALDAEGVVAIDGFVGTLRRVFRPESFDQDLYFPAETTEGRVHRLDRVIHLYKLHGSVTWRRDEPTWDDPFGVSAVGDEDAVSDDVLVYPTQLKYGQTLGLPYSEMFRRFGAAIVRPQTVLFAIGYGFGDEHVNAIVRQALVVPSFILVIVDPAPNSPFVNALKKQADTRAWVFEGDQIGRFDGFTDQLLPDLREEQILKDTVRTFRALDPANLGPPADEGAAPEAAPVP